MPNPPPVPTYISSIKMVLVLARHGSQMDTSGPGRCRLM